MASRAAYSFFSRIFSGVGARPFSFVPACFVSAM
jgi:hypothetical protein